MNASLLRACLGLLSVAACSAQVITLPGPGAGIPATPPPQKLSPPFATDSITLLLAEDTTVPADTGRSVAELAAAIGGTISTDVRLGADRYLALQLAAGVKFGQAYRAVQTFDFGTPSRWRVKSAYPNFFVYIPEAVPFSAQRVFNFSARAEVRTDESATIGGLVVPGNFAQLVVIKVRGASLAALGVSQPLTNPVVRLYQGGTLLLQNDNWTSLRTWELEVARAVCPPPEESRESMLVTYLDPGAYTAILSGANGETGVAVLEFYLVDSFNVTSAN